ncbi:unnamed protein product, partial [Effrenium voratum]
GGHQSREPRGALADGAFGLCGGLGGAVPAPSVGGEAFERREGLAEGETEAPASFALGGRQSQGAHLAPRGRGRRARGRLRLHRQLCAGYPSRICCRAAEERAARTAAVTDQGGDSGAAARVSSKPGESASVEIAGSYWSKMRALLEISAVVMQMQAESPKLGLCLREEKLSVEEAVEAAKPFTPDARAGARRAGRFVLELVGPAAPVCGAAMAVCRESERKALALERKQGPPGLLVDYLARWFGRDAGRMLRERGSFRGRERHEEAKDCRARRYGASRAGPRACARGGGSDGCGEGCRG